MSFLSQRVGYLWSSSQEISYLNSMELVRCYERFFALGPAGLSLSARENYFRREKAQPLIFGMVSLKDSDWD